jgi:hypothetical protein
MHFCDLTFSFSLQIAFQKSLIHFLFLNAERMRISHLIHYLLTPLSRISLMTHNYAIFDLYFLVFLTNFFFSSLFLWCTVLRVDNKNLKNEINKEMSSIGNEAKGFFQQFFRDVSKKSATKQILIGASSGW